MKKSVTFAFVLALVAMLLVAQEPVAAGWCGTSDYPHAVVGDCVVYAGQGIIDIGKAAFNGVILFWYGPW